MKGNRPEDKLIVDSPGYKDNRGLVVDISNVINIPEQLHSCKSILPVLLINYHEL